MSVNVHQQSEAFRIYCEKVVKKCSRKYCLIVLICLNPWSHVTGSGRGVLIPHSRSFFTRILYPTLFHRYPEFRFFFPKNTLKRLISAKANKFKM